VEQNHQGCQGIQRAVAPKKKKALSAVTYDTGPRAISSNISAPAGFFFFSAVPDTIHVSRSFKFRKLIPY
jgi:hypothetical protein